MSPKPSIHHFRPNFKPLGYRSPHWAITNYFAKVQAKMTAHPFFKQFSKKQQPWNDPTSGSKLG